MTLELENDDWYKIRKDYETTKTSYRKLSDKCGYTKNAIANRSKAEGWVKFSVARKILVVNVRERFAKNSEVKLYDLIESDDEAFGKMQNMIAKDLPYAEIINTVVQMSGEVSIKMDGTIKSLTEALVIAGDKRREFRGMLPLKDEKLIELKNKEFEEKKQQNKINNEFTRSRIELERERIKLDGDPNKDDKKLEALSKIEKIIESRINNK